MTHPNGTENNGTRLVTASQLYDHVSCPRRVDLDAHGDQSRRAELSAFVRMLWERGSLHEADVVAGLPADAVRVAGLPGHEREVLTREAMAAGVALIQGGRIASGDLLGDPDLLIRRGGRYVAADIKSGRAEEGGRGRRRRWTAEGALRRPGRALHLHPRLVST